MNCTEARDLMLQAELDDLGDTSETELGRHLRSCASCRAAALHILAAEAELRERLSATAPRRATPVVLQAGLARRARRGRVVRFLLPAAAAVIAVFVLSRGQPLPPAQPVAVTTRPALRVTAPHGRSVAVLRTDNPDIVVYWFF